MQNEALTWTNTTLPVDNLKPYGRNPRNLTAAGLESLKRSITENGYHAPIIVDTDMVIVAGHQRLRALKEMGHTQVDVRIPHRKLTKLEFDQINLRDNVSVGEWDTGMLLEDFEMPFLADMGLPMDIFGTVEPEKADGKEGATGVSLADRFLVPPFSVLDARQGYWQERKRTWLEKGIQSELGREELGTTVVATDWMKRGTDAGGSVFDPVLCEIAYRWFSPKGGTVLDCFAGGSVRGVVAAMLGRQYVGVELRKEQVEANRQQWEAMEAEAGEEALAPVWHNGDSAHIGQHCKGVEADLLFSCPPYADLEKYSDDPADISNMPYPKFLEAYRAIIRESCRLLKDDTFAVWVVGEVRGKNGAYVNLVGDTIQAFLDAGMAYYNEAILVTPVGSLPLRTGRQFSAGRKFGKTHQNVLVFVKGDAKKATLACGEVEVEVPEPAAEETAENSQ